MKKQPKHCLTKCVVINFGRTTRTNNIYITSIKYEVCGLNVCTLYDKNYSPSLQSYQYNGLVLFLRYKLELILAIGLCLHLNRVD